MTDFIKQDYLKLYLNELIAKYKPLVTCSCGAMVMPSDAKILVCPMFENKMDATIVRNGEGKIVDHNLEKFEEQVYTESKEHKINGCLSDFYIYNFLNAELKQLENL